MLQIYFCNYNLSLINFKYSINIDLSKSKIAITVLRIFISLMWKKIQSWFRDLSWFQYYKRYASLKFLSVPNKNLFWDFFKFLKSIILWIGFIVNKNFDLKYNKYYMLTILTGFSMTMYSSLIEVIWICKFFFKFFKNNQKNYACLLCAKKM